MISSPSSHAKGLISKPTKSTNYIVPMWQYEDVEHDARVKHMAKKPSDFEPRTRLGSNKRTRDSTVSAMSAAVRRMSVKARSTGGNQAVIRDRGPELTRLKGVIAPNLFLTNDGNLDDPDSDDSMGDNVRFQPQPKTALRKVIQRSGYLNDATDVFSDSIKWAKCYKTCSISPEGRVCRCPKRRTGRELHILEPS